MRNYCFFRTLWLVCLCVPGFVGLAQVATEIPEFRKVVIYPEFISEGVACADVNRDGHLDIIAGQYWFAGPEWQQHEVMPPKKYDYKTGYSDSFLNFTMDVDEDGWQDLIVFGFPGQTVHWYRNPAGSYDQHWQEHLIDSMACNESPMMTDLNGDGRMELVYGHETSGEMMVAVPKAGTPVTWRIFPISAEKAAGTNRFSHGLGAGDVNGDGHKDIVVREGWYENPGGLEVALWDWHPADLGEPCSQMHTYDFDMDGDADILAASAHAYGIWWYEQEGTEFQTHLIDSTFSQTHGSLIYDMDSDGLPDLVTGKRFFAHQGKDPGGLEPAVLYWLQLQHDARGQPIWQKHLIDSDSGAGLQVVIADLNRDGKPDIINSNKKGVICFVQE